MSEYRKAHVKAKVEAIKKSMAKAKGEKKHEEGESKAMEAIEHKKRFVKKDKYEPKEIL